MKISELWKSLWSLEFSVQDNQVKEIQRRKQRKFRLSELQQHSPRNTKGMTPFSSIFTLQPVLTWHLAPITGLLLVNPLLAWFSTCQRTSSYSGDTGSKLEREDTLTLCAAGPREDITLFIHKVTGCMIWTNYPSSAWKLSISIKI